MKLLKSTILLLFWGLQSNAQITTPIIKAFFGVDADLRANYFNSSIQSNDDWFHNGNSGAGIQIIDSTGAAATVARYVTDINYRRASIVRGMAVPVYSTINNKLLYDALFVRDHFGDDSTTFISSNKNGQNPADWDGTGIATTPSQPVLNKNDIYDVFVHLRRDGINLTDSLWFFGGISLQGNTGNRYFDFELYQTDIYYDRNSGTFLNVGPDAGHTSWQFDAAGNVISAGDVIFTAEFSSSSLTLVEARIWVHQSNLSITPVKFNWGGSFDGDGPGATYGYANITPKVAGDFYTGLQCGNATWPGPFGYINAGGAITATYSERQFMEISVNMTKLGLDPYTLLASTGCRAGFKRLFVKTRSSTSFTSELKDFIGPYDFAKPQPVDVRTNFPNNCPTNLVTQLFVLNPLPNSVYEWSTPNGNIINNPARGPQININAPGKYIVKQQLFTGCEIYAEDTIEIVYSNNGCSVLSPEQVKLEASIVNTNASLRWTLPEQVNEKVSSFSVERSNDNQQFAEVASVTKINGAIVYEHTDVHGSNAAKLYYRLKIITTTGATVYTNTVTVQLLSNTSSIRFYPNPVQNQLYINTSKKQSLSIKIVDANGVLILKRSVQSNGSGIDISHLKQGTYMIHVISDDGSIISTEKIMKQ